MPHEQYPSSDRVARLFSDRLRDSDELHAELVRGSGHGLGPVHPRAHPAEVGPRPFEVTRRAVDVTNAKTYAFGSSGALR